MEINFGVLFNESLKSKSFQIQNFIDRTNIEYLRLVGLRPVKGRNWSSFES